MEFPYLLCCSLPNFALGVCSSLIFLTLCVPLPQTLATVNTEVAVVPKPTLQYCSFFANRAPNIQLGLKNCTWFKGNSCCRQEEIDAIFPRVKPLRGSSPACQRYTNYLMCYVCAPNQNRFYMMESLTVCEEFCDAWYEACHKAILKGSVIKQLYSNGSEYCRSRRFKVEPAAEGNCFFFDAKQDKSGGVPTVTLRNESSKHNLMIGGIGFALHSRHNLTIGIGFAMLVHILIGTLGTLNPFLCT